ncbi:MAG: hypothetical protein ACI3YK_06730 [Eubacteriales bacterium]
MKSRRMTACILVVLLAGLTACTGGEPTATTTTDTSTVSVTTQTGLPPVTSPVTAPVTNTTEEGKVTLTFGDQAGITYVCDKRSGASVEKGSTVSFSLKKSVFYEGTPVVSANGEILTPNDGTYSVTVNENTRIEVSGITLIESTMEGGGTGSDDPFLITSPVDLLFIAEQVNAGNSVYSEGYYTLSNDLDFLGEEIEVIGDGRNEYAYFSGYFDGGGYTISNFTLTTTDTPYVGLFGILQANVVDSVGGTVYMLNLKDFTITAEIKDNSMFCGSFAGYGIGANLLLCNAQNGKIEVYADSNNFSYAGGLVGLQQALDYNNLSYLSAVTYCTSDVDVSCREGLTFSAGGISGYLACSNALVVASINNSYATGDVQGASRTGGIAGYMSSNTGIVGCYATGIISAQSSISDYENSETHCYAYAGGIAGCAEENSVISECFATGKLYCKAELGSAYEKSDGVLGGAEAVTEGAYSSYEATVYNCVYALGGTDGDINLTDGTYLREKLNWNECDWVFKDGSYPTVNLAEDNQYSFDINFNFEGQETLSVTEFDAYMPMFFWYLDGSLPTGLIGEEGDTHTSYGYFFDEELTMPIPAGFVPTHTMTIYAASADYAEVAGEYVLLTSNKDQVAYLTLNTNGSFTYTDGADIATSYFRYDGETLVFEDARLARYAENVLSMEKYQYCDFMGRVEDGKLTILGGVVADDTGSVTFFTEKNPLIALSTEKVLTGAYRAGNTLYTFAPDGTGTRTVGGMVSDFTYTRNGNAFVLTYDNQSVSGSISAGKLTLEGTALTACDEYMGSWTVDSKANKVFTFDGAGNWSYEYYGYLSTASKTVLERKTGSYTVNYDGSLTLSGGFGGSAKFVDGVLRVSTTDGSYTCYRQGSYYGTWIYPDYGMTLILGGIGESGVGTARVEYLYDNGTVEFYNLTYSLDNLIPGVICIYYDMDVFGYLSYVPGSDILNATIYVGPLASFMQNVSLCREDEYMGQWISEKDGLTQLEFNGFGSYASGNRLGLSGIVEIDGHSVPYTLDEATLSGSFVYNGKIYLISYDETKSALILSDGGSSTVYQRKDAFAALTLSDESGRVYSFDGRGNLSSMGTMSVTEPDGRVTTYQYRLSGNELTIYQGTGIVGRLYRDEQTNAYRLTLSGTAGRTLMIRTSFTGTWGMSGSLENLVIGTMGLDNTIEGRINGENVTFIMEDGYLSFTYLDALFYIIQISDGDLIISQQLDWYMTTDGILCAPIDDLFGTWTNSLGASYEFDGMSNSTLTSGSAQSSSGETVTGYFYLYDDEQYILWTYSETTGETILYRLIMCDPDTRRAFVNGDRAFTVEQGDNLYKAVVRDVDSEIVYTFDGFGKVTTSEGETYEYSVTSIDLVNGIAIVRITIGDEVKTATIDFSDSSDYTMTLR